MLSNVDFRKGYAGYEFDQAIGSKYHVRYRVLDSTLGRWMNRDPIGYEFDMNLAAYAHGCALYYVDHLGLSGDVLSELARSAKNAADRISDVVDDIADVARDTLESGKNTLSAVMAYATQRDRIEQIKKAGREAAATVDPQSPTEGPGETALHNYARHCVGACLGCKEWGLGVGGRGLFLNEVKEDLVDALFGTQTGADDSRDTVANDNGLMCCQSQAACYVCCMWRWPGGAASESVNAMEHNKSIYRQNAEANGLALLKWTLRLVYNGGE